MLGSPNSAGRKSSKIFVFQWLKEFSYASYYSLHMRPFILQGLLQSSISGLGVCVGHFGQFSNTKGPVGDFVVEPIVAGRLFSHEATKVAITRFHFEAKIIGFSEGQLLWAA